MKKDASRSSFAQVDAILCDFLFFFFLDVTKTLAFLRVYHFLHFSLDKILHFMSCYYSFFFVLLLLLVLTKIKGERFVVPRLSARCPSNAPTASLQKRGPENGPLLASPFHLLYTHAFTSSPFAIYSPEPMPQQVAARYDYLLSLNYNVFF